MLPAEKRYYILEALWAAGTAMTGVVYVIFLQSHGLTLLQAGYVNVVFWFLTAVFEPLTGALADKYGYRTSVMLASLTWGVGLVVYGLSNTIPMFMLSEAILAFGLTCISGALDAWLVDALYAKHMQTRIRVVMSRRLVIKNLTAIVFVFVAGLLADVDLRVPWILGGVMVGVFATAFTWHALRPVVPAPIDHHETHTPKEYMTILRHGFKEVSEKKILLQSMVASALFLMAVSAPNMHWQPLFKPLFGDTNTALGLIAIGMKLTVAVGAFLAVQYWISTQPSHLVLALCSVIVGAGIVGSVIPESSAVALLWFYIHEIGRGMFSPTLQQTVHEHTSNGIRATVISVFSMGERIGGMIGLVLFGYLATHYSIDTAWCVAGLVLLVVALLFWKIHQNNNTHS